MNHNLRKSLSLGILEYEIASIIHSFKTPVSLPEISQIADEDMDMIRAVVEQLNALQYVKIAPKSGKVTVSDLWKQETKVKKETREINPLIHLMHLAIIDPNRVEQRTDYQWSAAESRWADQLSTKIKSAFRIKHGVEGTNEQIIETFCLIIDNLTPYWNDGFSVCRLNTFYNDVISCARAEIKKKQSKGKIVDNAVAIRKASEGFTPRKFR